MTVENNELREDELTESAPRESQGAESTASSDDAVQMRAERDELRDLLLRRQAEFDNFRRRSERERSDYLQYASMEAVKSLLPVVDDFERALKSEGGSPDYVKGIEMIHARMLETLKKLGLEPLDAVGKPFDPHLHQAIERVENTESEDGTVLGEFQRGYFFKGKLLRPAMVRVAVHS